MKITTKPDESPTKCLMLIRVSTDLQAAKDKAGIPAQIHACERIAQDWNLEIAWTMQIEGVSGARIADSPSMARIFQIAKLPECKGIIIKEASRLMRPDDLGDYGILERLGKLGVKLYLPEGPMNLESSDQKMMSIFKFAIAGQERRVIKERMRGGKKAKMRRGEWTQGEQTVPLGFKLKVVEKCRFLTVDPETMPRVLRLFDLFTGGVTNKSLLSRETGIHLSSIPNVLCNELYTGWHVIKRIALPEEAKYTAEGKVHYYRKKAVPAEEQERHRMLEESPVSIEQFALAQRLLKHKAEVRTRTRLGGADPFAYRGVLLCALCGRTITSYRVAKYEYYACMGTLGRHRRNKGTGRFEVVVPHGTCRSVRVRREVLEEKLDQLVVKLLGNPNLLEELIEAAEEKPDFDENREQNLKTELAALERRQKKILDLYLKDKITEKEYDFQEEQREREKKIVEVELKRLRPPIPTFDTAAWSVIVEEFQQWPMLDVQIKRRLLATVDPRIRLWFPRGERYHSAGVEVKEFSFNPGDSEESQVSFREPSVSTLE